MYFSNGLGLGTRIRRRRKGVVHSLFQIFFLLTLCAKEVTSKKGDIGSKCDNGWCRFPGVCTWDGFCTCSIGIFHESNEVCVHYESVATSEQTLILIGVLVLLIVLNKTLSSWKSFRVLCRRVYGWRICTACGGGDQDSQSQIEYSSNPGGRNKSAAFTISSREFLATSNDPDLEWALELSVQVSAESPQSPPVYAESDQRERLGQDDTALDLQRHRSFSSNGSSFSNISLSHNSPDSSSVASASYIPFSTLSTPTGTIPKSTPTTARRSDLLNSERIPSNSIDGVILNNVILNRRSISSSSAGSFRRVESLPARVRRKKRRKNVPMRHGNPIIVASFHSVNGSISSHDCHDISFPSTPSSYSSVVSNLSTEFLVSGKQENKKYTVYESS